MHLVLKRHLRPARLGAIALGLLAPLLAQAAGGSEPTDLHVMWALPFVGLLLSIAILPMAAPQAWHAHRGKLALAWSLGLLLPWAAQHGPGAALHEVMTALLHEYLPFVLLMGTLYTVAGGIHIRGRWRASPGVNLAFLLAGAVLASFMGTTGAAMLLIRPLLQTNAQRRHQTHVVVFFIFIVANAGGVLTPLGDPPLFLGYLAGVPFSWPLLHLWPQALWMVGALLAVFWLLDHLLRHRDHEPAQAAHLHAPGVDGARNLFLLAAAVALLLWSGSSTWAAQWQLWGVSLRLVDLLRDAGLLGLSLVSLRITPARVYEANRFNWAPMVEVAQLFAAIFITIMPVLAMLRLGPAGPFAPLLASLNRGDGSPDPLLYFWVTGVLSAFLDNAPTYLIFFNLAGGQVDVLTGARADTLAAISSAAVFMGAMTYIGNAPNLMVKSMAHERGVVMPGFGGYMLWSAAIMLPLLWATSLFWFH